MAMAQSSAWIFASRSAAAVGFIYKQIAGLKKEAKHYALKACVVKASAHRQKSKCKGVPKIPHM